MSLWSKLNLKDQASVLVFDTPDDVRTALAPPPGVSLAVRIPSEAAVDFALVFVTDEPGIALAIGRLEPRLVDDAVLWFAYPKKTSKRYASSISRDSGWSVLGEAGYEPVRQVAIDEDWSALRFRKVQHITKMTRRPSMTLSEAGRKRTAARRE
jgi:hypothetical protein